MSENKQLEKKQIKADSDGELEKELIYRDYHNDGGIEKELIEKDDNLERSPLHRELSPRADAASRQGGAEAAFFAAPTPTPTPTPEEGQGTPTREDEDHPILYYYRSPSPS